MRVYQFRHIRGEAQCSQGSVRERFENLVGVLAGFTSWNALATLPVGVDDERRALDAHVRLAGVRLLAPDAVGIRDRVVRVGEQA